MPVYKFSSVDEMQRARRAQGLLPDDPRLPRVIRFVWTLSWEMAGRFIPPRGVFKFRSIEEANAHRKAWEQERVDRLRSARDNPPPNTST